MLRDEAVRHAAAFRKLALAGLAALVVPAAVIEARSAAAQEWRPDKPVEIVATNAPGGGSDRIGRMMIKILQDGRYVPTAVNLRFSKTPFSLISIGPYTTTLSIPGLFKLVSTVSPRLTVPSVSTGSASGCITDGSYFRSNS